MIDYKEVFDLFSKLDINDKKNELNILIQKIEALLSELLAKKNINDNNIIENKTNLEGEDELLLSYYEELTIIKNKILLLMTVEMNKE